VTGPRARNYNLLIVNHIFDRHILRFTPQQYRLHEFDRQAAAIRAGLGTIVPISLLVSICQFFCTFDI